MLRVRDLHLELSPVPLDDLGANLLGCRRWILADPVVDLVGDDGVPNEEVARAPVPRGGHVRIVVFRDFDRRKSHNGVPLLDSLLAPAFAASVRRASRPTGSTARLRTRGFDGLDSFTRLPVATPGHDRSCELRACRPSL